MAIPICPRCGGPIPSAEHAGQYPGALSRADNKTEICSQCGTGEALRQIGGAAMTFAGWKNPPSEAGSYGASQRSQ